MKKTIAILMGIGLAVCAMADDPTIKTTFTERDVRNPRALRRDLSDNFATIDSYFGTAGIGLSQSLRVLGSTGQPSFIDGDVNAKLTDGDMNRLLFHQSGGLRYQTDEGDRGSLTDRFQIGSTGILTLKGTATIDNTTDAAVLNLTRTTVRATGAFHGTSTAQIDGIITSGKETSTGGLVINDDGNDAKFTVLGASGNTDIQGTLDVDKKLTVDDAFEATGNATIGGTLGVTGKSTLGVLDAGNTEVDGTFEVTGASTLAAVRTGNLNVGADTKFAVTAEDGNLLSEGAISAKGGITSGLAAQGSPGSINIFPTTADRGKLIITHGGNSGGNHNVTINVAAQSKAGVTELIVPDVTDNAAFVMTRGNQTISGNKTFDGNVVIEGSQIGIDTDNFNITAASGNLSIGSDDEFVVTAASGNIASKGTINAKYNVISAGVDTTLTAAQSGSLVMLNTADVVTLPDADGNDGVWYDFLAITVETTEPQVKGAGTDNIWLANEEGGDGEYIQAGTIGATIRLVSDGTDWRSMQITGTWGAEND